MHCLILTLLLGHSILEMPTVSQLSKTACASSGVCLSVSSGASPGPREVVAPCTPGLHSHPVSPTLVATCSSPASCFFPCFFSSFPLCAFDLPTGLVTMMCLRAGPTQLNTCHPVLQDLSAWRYLHRTEQPQAFNF